MVMKIFQGIYLVDEIGSSKQSFVLSRNREYDSELKDGDLIYIEQGSTFRTQMFITTIKFYSEYSNNIQRHKDRNKYFEFNIVSGDANHPYSMVKRINPFSIENGEMRILKFNNRGKSVDIHDPEQIFFPKKGTFIISIPGLYLISANIYIRSGVCSGIHKLKLFYNRGKHTHEITRAVIKNQNDVNLTFGSRILHLLAGDKIYLVYENRTGSFVVIGQTGLDFFNIVRLR